MPPQYSVVDQSRTGTIDNIIGPLSEDEAYQLKERMVKTQQDRETDGEDLFDPESIHVFELKSPSFVDEDWSKSLTSSGS